MRCHEQPATSARTCRFSESFPGKRDTGKIRQEKSACIFLFCLLAIRVVGELNRVKWTRQAQSAKQIRRADRGDDGGVEAEKYRASSARGSACPERIELFRKVVVALHTRDFRDELRRRKATPAFALRTGSASAGLAPVEAATTKPVASGWRVVAWPVAARGLQ